MKSDLPDVSRWSALLHARCPRCRRGSIFYGPRWPRLPRMVAQCAVCGLKFEREEGYFLGAMYISYGLALAAMAAIAALLWSTTTLRWEKLMLAVFLIFLPLAPLLTVVARVLWIHFDQTLDPERQ